MDKERALEILQSFGVIEVKYNGSPVWIENINGSTAEVTYMDSKKKTEVQIENLTEEKH